MRKQLFTWNRTRNDIQNVPVRMVGETKEEFSLRRKTYIQRMKNLYGKARRESNE